MITARQLAIAYDLSVASFWRGDAPDDPLIDWLGRYRTAEAPPEPKAAPDAVSLLGGGGSGIRWYSTPTAILGFASGHPGVCYRIPIDATLPTAQPAVHERIIPIDLGTAML
jgi:hypothetical protein